MICKANTAEQNTNSSHFCNNSHCNNFAALMDKIEEIINAAPSQPADNHFLSIDSTASALTALLQSHPLTVSDWLPYAHFHPDRYTRNLIGLGQQGRFGLMVLAWGPGQKSPIHDHAQSHCVMRVLDGSLKESLFTVVSDHSNNSNSSSNSSSAVELSLKCETLLNAGDVAYIHDRIGWHQVSNASSDKPALSLHLYAPPIEQCRSVVDEADVADDGRVQIRSAAACPYYSKCGRVIGFPAEAKRNK